MEIVLQFSCLLTQQEQLVNRVHRRQRHHIQRLQFVDNLRLSIVKQVDLFVLALLGIAQNVLPDAVLVDVADFQTRLNFVRAHQHRVRYACQPRRRYSGLPRGRSLAGRLAPVAGRLIGKYPDGLLGGIGMAMFACGLWLLAAMPVDVAHWDMVWRMLLAGSGFALYQSPNNHTIVSSAPAHRSGGASGMLGTARLLGQSSGAALVALMFNLAGQNGNHVALLTAGALASLAAVVSGLRVTQPRVQA